jgi:hypothetical protein
MEGLAQSNNNATLNKGAKHDQTLLEMSAKSDESKRSNHGEGEVLVEGGRKKERNCRTLGGTASSVLVFHRDRLRPSENRVRERFGAVPFGVYIPWTFLFFSSFFFLSFVTFLSLFRITGVFFLLVTGGN